MAGLGWVLGVGAALCWSALDAVRKSMVADLRPITVAMLLMVGQAPFFLAWAAYGAKWVNDASYWLPAVGSMGVNALANVLFMKSVQLSPLSRTVPFLSLAPVFSAVIAMPLLQEMPSAFQWLGIGLVIVGAFTLNSDLSSSLVAALTKEKGVPLMMAVAALWASSTVFDKVALPHASVASHSFILTTGSAVMLFAWLALRGQVSTLGDVREAPVGRSVLLIGFAGAALALQMFALEHLFVSAVETLKRGIGVIGSIVLGRLLFREPLTTRKAAAVALMLAGTLLLTLNP